jgi:hypothetical protein
VTIEVLVAGTETPLARVKLSEATQDNIIWFSSPPAAGSEVSFRLGSPAKFGSCGGRVWLMCAELMDYRPWLWDLLLVLRLGGSNSAI